MPSSLIERAIYDAQTHGKALLKFISGNDVGTTGSHQCGFYLPKATWSHYTCNPPEQGKLSKEDVKITWQDGQVTESVITWYGRKTRSEYRLTRFGRDFQWLSQNQVGSLLMLIPRGKADFLAYIAETDDDIEDVISALGLSGFDESWALFDSSQAQVVEDPDACVSRNFAEFIAPISDFPAPREFSKTTFETLSRCLSGFSREISDSRLLKLIDYEYRLFRLAEKRIYSNILTRPFESIDQFLKTASSIMNRRKSRAGASFENHVETILRSENIPFASHPVVDKTEPDIIIPSAEAYYNQAYPPDKIFVLALKTTCKDRWRQVVSEAPKVRVKHLLTVQQGISQNQLDEISRADVSLVVPAALHGCYPSSGRSALSTVESFISRVKTALDI